MNIKSQPVFTTRKFIAGVIIAILAASAITIGVSTMLVTEPQGTEELQAQQGDTEPQSPQGETEGAEATGGTGTTGEAGSPDSTGSSGPAETATSTSKNKLLEFMSDVIGVDLAEYVKTRGDGYGVSYPPEYGGLAEEEVWSLKLNSSDGGYISAFSIYDNEFVKGISIRLYGPTKYLQQPPTDTLDYAKVILTRYQTLIQGYSMDTQHVSSALAMLDKVDSLSTSNVIEGNMKMEIMNLTDPNRGMYEPSISFGWTYSVNGMEASRKNIRVGFYSSAGSMQIAFSDTWGFWSVNSTSAPEAEVREVAWQAAQDFNLTLVGPDGSVTIVKPDWGNVSRVAFYLIPGQLYDSSLNDVLQQVSMGSRARNGLTLYPLWEFIFYFSERVAGNVGVQVGVWGDTGEIAYCIGYGV
jgi:hypothetical protein